MLRIMLVLTLISALMAGCQSNNQAENNQSQEKIVYVQDKNGQTQNKKSGQDIAIHLANLASSVPNVNDATAVVAGKYAVVGIDVDAKLDRSRVGSIKYSVAESLNDDPYGAKAVIVADPDTFTRLKEMGKQIKAGKPVSGFMDELAAIVGRVMPQIPSETKKNEDPTKQNKQQLSNQEGQDLDRIQNKQANQKKDKNS